MQKLKGKAKQIILAVTAILLVVGVVCGVVLNLNNNTEQVSNETPIKVKVLGITENAESGETVSQERDENLKEGEEAGTKEINQIGAKDPNKAEVLVGSVNYAKQSHTIKLQLDGTDNIKVQNANLTADNITVKVGGTALNPQPTKSLSAQSNLNDGKDGKTYELTLSGVTGDGQLSISIAANTITDHLGNANGEISSTFDTPVYIDNTAPTKPSVVGKFASGGAAYSSGAWANSQINATLSTTEAGSGVKEFKISLDNKVTWTKLNLTAGALSQSGTTWTGTEPCPIADGRTYSAYFKAIDYLGNESPVSDLFEVNYDTTAPTISLSLGTDGYASSIPVNVTVNDSHSSIVSTKYAKGTRNVAYFATNGTNVVNNTFNTTENGIYTVFAQDEAGNTAVSTIEVTKIDKTNPVITADDEFDGEGVFFTINDIAPDDNEVPSGVNNYKITDSNTAPTSGWTEIEVPEVTLVDGKQQISNRVALTNTHLSVGTHYIWVKDRAGHTASKEISIYYTITLDNQDATTPGTTSVKADSTTLSNITTPTKTGKSFGGYYTQTGGAGTKYYNANGTPSRSNNFTEDTTLYAQWNSNTVTVNVTKNSSAWVDSGMKVALYIEDTLKYETTSSGSGVSTAVFSDVTNGTYDVYAGKSAAAKTELMDTGARVTINNDSKSGNIYYVDLTLVAGTGISSVSGAGTYLYNILGNQQEIPIDAAVTAGYTWSTWTITSGSLTAPTTPEAATIKSQNVKIKTGAVTLTASATYTATPVITRSDYNTFTYTADSGVAYYVSTSNSAPTNANAQSDFTLNKWTTATNTGNLTLAENTTYYVWAKDAATGGNISSNYATIAVRKVVKTQGEGTTLTIRYDTPSGPQQTSGNGYVLDGTTIWMTATANDGYSNAALLYHDYRYPGYGEKNASGDNLVVSADVEISSNAIANKATIVINKDGSAWANSGIKVALYKNGTKKYEATSSGSGVTNAEMTPVANNTYDVYAGKSDGATTDLIDTGLDITINNNSPMVTINYYTVTLSKGTGISSVSGSGSYLYKSSGTQQEIEINATEATGFSWNTWSKTEGTDLATFTAGTKNQNIKLGQGAVTLQASAIYTATPVITREDFNTFSYSADSASKYFVSPTQSTKPESGTKGWTSATNTGDLTLAENTTYYVWAKYGDQVSPNCATIAVRKIVKNQGEGTNLTVKYDTTVGTSGLDMDGDNLCVLHGTPIWARATTNSGYHDVKLYKGETEITGAAGTFNAENNETLTSSATANTVTITIKKDNTAWVNSGINVALYQGNTKKYEAISSGADVIRAIITGVENGNYDVYASKNDGAKTELIDTGVDISVSNNNTNANINYGTVTLVAGTGISEVSGGGIYLFVMNGGTQQNIAIDATVSAGFSWSTWTKTAGTTPATYTAGTKNQNIKLGEGPVTLTASATYTATPVITRQDFNTFTYTADSAAAYYVSTSNSTPANAAAQSAFALNKWTTATSTGNLTLTENTTYYVWTKNSTANSGMISTNCATIVVRKIVKDQATGSTLTIKYDTMVGTAGTEQTSAEQLVLDGTPIWMKAVENPGYHDPSLVYKDLITGTEQNKQATGDNCNVTSNIKLTSGAIANTITININKDDSAWANSGIVVQLHKGTPMIDRQEVNGAGVTSVTFNAVENGTYSIFATGKSGNNMNLPDTGLSITVNDNNPTGTIDYYTLTMTAGTGISEVSGAGIYLYKNSGNQQDIAIDATVAPGYTWWKWTYSGTSPSDYVGLTTKGQNIKLGKGHLSLTANATYTATPVITRNDYNTFSVSADGATQYYISDANVSTKPSGTSGTWRNITDNSGDLTLTKDAVYRVWVKNSENVVSNNYATISAWEILKNQYTGTTLTIRYDATSSSTGTLLSDSSIVVLNGTPIWASATSNSGYNSVGLYKGILSERGYQSTQINASGETFNAEISVEIYATAASNMVDITIKKDGNNWPNSKVEVQLLQNGSVKYQKIVKGSSVTNAQIYNVANGTYDVFASYKEGENATIDTGLDIVVNNNSVSDKVINYYTLTLTNDSGISSVSGDGVYLSKNSGIQQDIEIDANVKTGYIWDKWLKVSGTVEFSQGEQSQYINLDNSAVVLRASTIYAVTPTITLVDHNTFSYGADNGAAYYVSTSNSMPTSGANQSSFALDKWTTATSTGNLNPSKDTTYYVWAKDSSGKISSNYATISAKEVKKVQVFGTSLAIRVNSTSENSGSAWSNTLSNAVYLEGTQIWASVSANNAGYENLKLLENSSSRPANGYAFTLKGNTTLTSSADYTAVPTIERTSYNTFRANGIGANKFMYTLEPTKPSGNNTNMILCTETTENIELEKRPYYVWIRDEGGAVSPNYAVINAYEITRSQETGSTLNIDVDTSSENSSLRWGSSPSSQLVLEGTPIWAKAVANTGYNTSKLYYTVYGDQNQIGTNSSSQGTININADTLISSTASPNTYTVVYNKGNSSATGSMQNSTHTYNEYKALNANGYSLSGYIFNGWVRRDDNTQIFADGDVVRNLTTVNGATINLDAQWINPTSTYNYMITNDINGGTSYKNGLADTLSMCKSSGSTVTLLKDVSESSGGQISKSITINTNGKKLTLGGVASITSGNIVNVVGGGTIDAGSYCPFDVYGTLNITNATIQSNSTATINLRASSNVTINSGIVKSTNKHAINFSGAGTLTIKGGEVKHINSSSEGDAIYNYGGTVIIEGGTLSSDSSYAIRNYGNLSISGGTVSSSVNAGIYQLDNSSASTTITGGTVSGASVAISAKKGTLTIGNNDGVVDLSSPILKTDSTSYGTIDVDSSATCSVYDGKFGSKSSFRPLNLKNTTSVITNKPSGYELTEIGLDGGYYWGVLKYIITAPSTVYKPYTGSTVTGITDGSGYAVLSGGTGTAAGSYTATLSLTSPTTTAWSDGTTSNKNVTWYITRITDPGTIYISSGTKQVTLQKSANAGTLSIEQQPTGVATASISGNTLSLTAVSGARGSSIVKVKENNGGYVLTINIVVDTTAPTVGTVDATIVDTNKLDVSVTGGADDLGIAGYRVYNSSGTLQGSVATTETSATISLTTNTGWRTNDYVVKAYDKAGNETSTGVGIRYYYVGTVDGLRGFAASLQDSGTFENRIVKQTADINLSGLTSPLGSSALSDESKAFKGTYDGQNHTISNYTITRTDSSETINLSLFGYNSGTITNLNLSTFRFSKTGRNYAAGLVIYNNGTISNCTGTSIHITTGTNGAAGGLVYENNGTVDNCTCGGIILKGGTNADVLGGIVASNKGTVKNCILDGDTADTFEFASGTGTMGGIVGRNNSGGHTVENCKLSDTIWLYGAATNFGGIVGENVGSGYTATPGVNAQVISCNVTATSYLYSDNKGTITNVGGVVGNNSGDVDKCVSSVDISLLYYNLGGVIGKNTGSVSSSCNKGTLDWGTNCAYAGGIVGHNTGSIGAVYNTGNMGPSASSSSTYVGGISGYNNGNINLAYFTGTITKGLGRGVVHGQAGSGASGNQVYYLNTPTANANTTLGTRLNTYELKTIPGVSEEFEAAFKVDIDNHNNGYPLLKWETGTEPSEDTIYYASSSSGNSATISTTSSSGTVTFPANSDMSAYIPSYSNSNRLITCTSFNISILDVVSENRTIISLNCTSGTSKSLSNVLSDNSPAWVKAKGSGQKTINLQAITKIVKLP